MSAKPAETIQTLLEAEEQAKNTIEEARAARDARLKQAAAEADLEITQYREMKDTEYKDAVKKYEGTTGETSERIAAESKQYIKSTINAAKSNKATVADMLVSYVLNVDSTV